MAHTISNPMTAQLWLGDCIDKMKLIPDQSVDLVLCDPPYGTTQCAWDSVIPFELMWPEVERVAKKNAAICLFGSEPFSSFLRVSNIKKYRYDWVWDKKKAGNFNAVKSMPLMNYEKISVFGAKRYYPQMRSGKQRKKGGYYTNNEISTAAGTAEKNNDVYYPKGIITFTKADNSGSDYHPTAKPVPLLSYMINTYTRPGEQVLDFAMGSGSTGVACARELRNFIGIEKEKKYFERACQRIAAEGIKCEVHR